MTLGEGERREAAQRKRFWRILGGLGIAGGLTGFAYGLLEGGNVNATAIPAPIVLGVAALLLAIFLYGTWRFFSTIDEFELQDNLWGSTVGFYVYATVFPLWWLLSHFGLVGQPHDWAIFFLSLLAAALAYGWRKWRSL